MGQVKITFYGGVGEIGGNKILVEDKGYDVRLLLDFGKSFKIASQYYQFPIDYPSSLDELLDLGAIPQIENLYTREFLARRNGDVGGEEEPPVDACLISHAHMDHAQYISLLNRKIPVYVSECSYSILTAADQIWRTRLETNFSGIKFEVFKNGQKIKVGNLEIKALYVDHSIPGASAFILYTSEGPLAYTGDFRLHGTFETLTSAFIDALRMEEKIIALIFESTSIFRSRMQSERNVEDFAGILASACRGLVIADFSSTDFFRFQTFYKVARKCGREIVITERFAKIVEAINQYPEYRWPGLRSSGDIRIIPDAQRRERWREEMRRRFPDLYINWDEVRKNPQKYIFCTSYNSVRDLRTIKPEPGSIYILSSSEPFNEERELAFEKLLNWLEKLNVPMYRIHASGHATPHEIQQLVHETRPKVIIPIHTEYPAVIAGFLQGLSEKSLIPEKGITYEIQ
ncbi:MAG: MBL fold metallo-hydrolase [Candidatus Baldrarchaeia archaeon]